MSDKTRRAKDFSREKLKTWIELHGARPSGMVRLKNNNNLTRQGLSVFFPRHLAAHQKRSQNILPLMGCVFFCSGIINLLFDGLTFNTRGHFAHCSFFSSPLRGSEKYYVTRKISARIICLTIE